MTRRRLTECLDLMVSEATGALEAVGFDFVTLDEQGRILSDHQYFDTPPTYVVPAPGETD
ncbi:hypothetical protein [Streptomyces bauhiniae]|uniref:Uncharacterized protein n=1 Tax=Streptomyces bauhiniae TaxID=2340725 RepID=A0A7K3QQ82_9ACTN|nr:hypothetical protein [Streptomyces bauhiniae]NEB92035.1 hypothetical protein [Streptomyces bauhiniae]